MALKQKASWFVLDDLRARLILALACFAFFGNAVLNGYSLDDDFAFYNNPYVQEGVAGIPDLLTHPYLTEGNMSVDYRPVSGISLAIEKSIFGNNPHVSHLVNLLLYALAVLLFFHLLRRVLQLDTAVSLVVALLYACHPSHTEVVASIKNREEIFSILFCMLAFLQADRFFALQKGRDLVISFVLTLVWVMLSLLSKMTTLPMVAIMALLFFYKGYLRKKPLYFGLLGAIALASLLYSAYLFHIANRPVFDLENPLATIPDLSPKLGTTLESLWFYLKFMCWPYPFCFFYGYNTIPVIGIDAPLAIISLFVHLLLLVYGAIAFFRKDITGFFILAYFISISVYSNLIKPYTGIVSERALFFPGAWFVGAACSFVYARVKRLPEGSDAPARFITGFLALLLTVYAYLDLNRVAEWHDTISLMRNDLKHLGNSTLANYFFGGILKATAEQATDTAVQDRYLEEAKKYYYITNTISPAYPYGYFRLGLIYRYDRLLGDSAYYYFRKAYELNPTLNDVSYQYGRTEYEFGDINRASLIFSDLYKRLPGDTFTVFYRAMLLLKTGHYEEGHQVNAIMLKMAPAYYQPYYNEGLYYQFTGDSAKAVANYETSLRYGSPDQGSYKFLLQYYRSHGMENDAARIARLLQ